MEETREFSFTTTQASLDQTAWDFSRNFENICAAIDKAVEAGADRLDLGELDLTGYECNDDFARTNNRQIFKLLQAIAVYAYEKDPNLIVKVGHPWRLTKRDVSAQPGLEAERHNNRLFNRLDQPFNVHTTITGGQVHAMNAKLYLYRDGRGYEDRHFSQWSMRDANEAGGEYGTIMERLPDGRMIPFGQPIIQYHDEERNIRQNEVTAICETGWIGSRYNAPYDDSAYKKDGVIPGFRRYIGSKLGLLAIEPDSSPNADLKIDMHRHLAELASGHAEAVIKTDNLGSSGSTLCQAGHRLIAQAGKVISFGLRYSFNRAATTNATIRMHSAPESTAEKAHVIIPHKFNNADAKPKAGFSYQENPEQNGWDDPAYEGRIHEERVRMLSRWAFDYLQKTRLQGFVEALSGGADSSHNSAIVYTMVNLSMRELGVEGFLKEMSHLDYAGDIRKANEEGGIEAAIKVCMDKMLDAVYMGTDNSSKETEYSARSLIEGGVDENGTPFAGIGGEYTYMNIQHLVNAHALATACPDPSQMKPERYGQALAAIGKYLNQAAPECPTEEDRDRHLDNLDKQQDELRKAFPEFTGPLISAADPREVIAYENIQARVRTEIIQRIANVKRKIPIANPNLDEMLNAYATFAGDAHGGTVGFNAHLHKDVQISDMHYLFHTGLKGVMSGVRSLAAVLKLKPTAELQPKNKDGEVVQNDEDALQRNFAQMRRIGDLMLWEKIRDGAEDRLRSAKEVYEACKTDAAFEGVDENKLHNMVRISFAKYYGPAQNKIHAGVIAPTNGKNVDHQTSRRTSNLNGGMRNELAEMGLDLMRAWAEKDGIEIPELEDAILFDLSPDTDSEFLKAFDSAVWNRNKGPGNNIDYDLKAAYERIKSDGWDSVFPAPSGYVDTIRKSALASNLSLAA